MEDAVPPIPPAPAPPPPPSDSELKKWTVILTLSPLAGAIIPFGHLIAPLVIWLVKKTELPGLDPIGRANLNYQISWTIWMLIAVVLAVVGSCLILPMALPMAVGIAWLVITIISAMKASNGEDYKYPLSIEFLK